MSAHPSADHLPSALIDEISIGDRPAISGRRLRNRNRLRHETIAPEMKYLLVQPVPGEHRFERATVVSTHQTPDAAFAAIACHASRLEGFGIRPDAVELFVVDEQRRPVRRGD